MDCEYAYIVHLAKRTRLEDMTLLKKTGHLILKDSLNQLGWYGVFTVNKASLHVVFAVKTMLLGFER